MSTASTDRPVVLITGTRKGLGHFLAQYYLAKGMKVIGCSRGEGTISNDAYEHHCLDIADETQVLGFFEHIKTNYRQIDILINNAGIAAMNHAILTPFSTAEKLFKTNVLGTFLFSRESAKMMMRKKWGRIVNFSTVAVPLNLDGEAIYASSKAAVNTLTHILARELGSYGITVNAVGPTPIKTDLIAGVGDDKLQRLIRRQAIQRFGEPQDVANVIDFFIRPESSFITGQTVYLGGV